LFGSHPAFEKSQEAPVVIDQHSEYPGRGYIECGGGVLL
jgi:hypothetical protein